MTKFDRSSKNEYACEYAKGYTTLIVSNTAVILYLRHWKTKTHKVIESLKENSPILIYESGRVKDKYLHPW